LRNLTEYATNKLLNEIVDEAVREALQLQRKADKIRREQAVFEVDGKPYNYRDAALLEEGVHGLCEVLWKVFGGLPAYSILAIEKISRENKSDVLGFDSQDYVELFMEAFEGGQS
jgi:hypothetical protein